MKEIQVNWNGTHWVAETKLGRVAGRLDYVVDSLRKDGLNPKIVAPAIVVYDR